jgi:23S rRNA (cytidine1920-2'-O)/16S rRNA (cytidine1409-2'-O)-methyltransferase
MKKRIDLLLVEKGMCKGREKAKARIIAGDVFVAGQKVTTPSARFEENADIGLKGDDCPYVSRGGYKLEKAIISFEIGLQDVVCADIGASTGGFTDCMLQNGARGVYAVDVGYGQFDWGLRNDPRVTLFERTNARYIEPFDRPVGFVSADVSFISLALIFPAAVRIGADDMRMVALIKPQFEAGKDQVGKKGVVKDAHTHIQVIKDVRSAAAGSGLYLNRLDFSPIKGPNGNMEFLGLFSRDTAPLVEDTQIERVVAQAHAAL